MKASGIPEGPSRDPIKHYKGYLFKWKLITREGPGSNGKGKRKNLVLLGLARDVSLA
jgi:hypothetical protein